MRGPLFIVAENQTGGRGRHGRSWASPPGNLYASLLLTDPSALSIAPQLGFVAGVALALALRDLLGGDERLRLKWPNDVLFAGAKLAGLLLESATTPQGHLACVIGFGVNCRWHPEGLPIPPPTSAAPPAGRSSRETCWPRSRSAFGGSSPPGIAARALPAIRAAWLAIAAGVGETILVQSSSRTVTGTFRSIDPTGRLLVETAAGCVAVDAGDVFLHGAFPDDDPARALRTPAP